jgi:hypothetical protein
MSLEISFSSKFRIKRILINLILKLAYFKDIYFKRI